MPTTTHISPWTVKANDALGHAAVYAATLLQELLAGWLGADLGEYRHHVDSLHLYAHDLPAAERLPSVTEPGPAMTPLAVPWDGLDDCLRRVIAGPAGHRVRMGGIRGNDGQLPCLEKRRRAFLPRAALGGD